MRPATHEELERLPVGLQCLTWGTAGTSIPGATPLVCPYAHVGSYLLWASPLHIGNPGQTLAHAKRRLTMVGGICTKPAITASPETTVREEAHRMRSRRGGALVVINGSGPPVGLVTDRDITVKVVAQGI